MIAGSLEIQLMANIARLQRDMQGAREIVERNSQAMQQAAGAATRALGLLSGSFGIGQLIALTDQYTKFTAQIKLATNSSTEYANAMNSVRQIAKLAQQDISAIGTLYARIANGTEALGLSQQRLSEITSVVGLSLKVSGASAAESASAMLQLSQSFASGTLRGEEFNAVNEAAPRLMKALADGIGVPVGALKELASEGLITSRMMADALPGSLKALTEESKQVATIGGAFNLLKNNVLELVGTQAQASGTVSALTTGIGFLAENLNVLMAAMATVGAVKLGTWMEALVIQTYASVTANRALAASNLATATAQAEATAVTAASTAARVAELRASVLATSGNVALEITLNGLIPAQARAATAAEAHALALAGLSTAQRASSVSGAAAGAAMGLLGGPIGALIAVLGLGVTAWMAWGNSAKSEAEAAAKGVERSTASMIESLNQQIKKIDERNAARDYKPKLEATSEEQERIGKLQLQIQKLDGAKTKSQQEEVSRLVELNKLRSEQGLLEQKINEKNTKSADENRRKDLKKGEQIAQELRTNAAGVTKDYIKTLGEYEVALKSGAMTQGEYVAGLEQLAKKTYESSNAGKEAKKASKESTTSAKQEQSAYDRLAASIKGKIEENLREVAAEEKLRNSDKTRQQLMASLEQGSKKMTASHQAQAEALLQSLAASEKAVEVYRAQKKFEGERSQYAQAQMDTITGINASAQALEDEAAAFGKSATALKDLTVKRLEDKAAMLKQFTGLGETDPAKEAANAAELDWINQRVEALRREGAAKEAIVGLKLNEKSDESLRAAKEQAALYSDELQLAGLTSLEREKITAQRQIELKYAKEIAAVEKSGASKAEQDAAIATLNKAKNIESSAAVNKVVQNEFAKTSAAIEQSLTDALMRGFESGKGFATNLRDTLVNMFKTLILKPTISAVMTPVAGVITGAMGLSGPANAASTAGTVGNIASTAGAIGSAAGAFGGAFSAGAAIGTEAFSAGVTMMANASGMSSFMAGAGQALGAVGPVGWAAMGVLAAAALVSGRGETRAGATYGTDTATGRATKLEGPSGGEIAAQQSRQLFDIVQKGITSTLQRLGSTAVISGFTAGLESSTKGKGFAFAGGMINGVGFGENLGRNGGQFKMGDMTPEEALKQYEINLKQAAIQALQAATDLPKTLTKELQSLGDVSKIDPGQLDGIITSITTFPERLLTQFGSDRDTLVQKFAEGLALGDAVQAGNDIATMLVSSIEQTVMTTGAGQIFDIINAGIITPMLDALATGASVSEALSQSSIDAVVQKATEQAKALNALFTNVDFKAALDQIKTTVGTALGSAGAAMSYQPTYWQPDTSKAKTETSAAEKAAEDLAKRIKDVLDGLKTDGLSLQIDLLRAQGNDAAAALMELNKATEGWDDANRELYRQRLAENAVLKEQIRVQNSLNALHKESGTLAIQLLRAQGQEESALAAERKTATKLMTDAELGVYDYNRAIERQIATEESLNNLRSTGTALSIDLMRALEQNEQALSMQRELTIKSMTALEVAQYDANRSLEKLIDGIGKFKTAFDSAKSSLNLGGVPAAASISTAGLTHIVIHNFVSY